MAKKYFKCAVCGDIHYGGASPEECPTCHAKDAYKEIKPEEAKKVLKF